LPFDRIYIFKRNFAGDTWPSWWAADWIAIRASGQSDVSGTGSSAPQSKQH